MATFLLPHQHDQPLASGDADVEKMRLKLAISSVEQWGGT
jgi:hypothetical protein